MDDLVGGALGERRRCAGRRRWPARPPRRGRGPWRTTLPSGPASSTASSASKPPSTRDDPGRQQRHVALAERPTRPVVDDDVPACRDREARSTACGRAAAARAAGRRCRRRDAGHGVGSTPARAADAITVRTPDHAAIFAAATFDAIPPLPRADPAPPASASRAWSTSTISSISDAEGSRRGSAVSSPAVSVSSTSRSASRQVGDERGDAVVVAEADLVVGDGVVLVDHRHDAELEQPPQRAPGVQVLLADAEVERRQQHLPARRARGRRRPGRRRRMSRP